jgi:hypothetical protein
MHQSIRGRIKPLTQGTCKIKRKKENPWLFELNRHWGFQKQKERKETKEGTGALKTPKTKNKKQKKTLPQSNAQNPHHTVKQVINNISHPPLLREWQKSTRGGKSRRNKQPRIESIQSNPSNSLLFQSQLDPTEVPHKPRKQNRKQLGRKQNRTKLKEEGKGEKKMRERKRGRERENFTE